MQTKPLPFNHLNPLQIKRFWDKVDKRSENECWPWTGAIKGKGYGNYAVNRIAIGTSRVGWFIVHGKDPHPLHILHSCDNRICCNPSHWFLGTNHDNILDMLKKRRHGTKRNALNLEKASAIKQMLSKGISQSVVAKEFAISPSMVSGIACGIHWKNA